MQGERVRAGSQSESTNRARRRFCGFGEKARITSTNSYYRNSSTPGCGGGRPKAGPADHLSTTSSNVSSESPNCGSPRCLSRGLCTLKVLRCPPMVSGLVKSQRKIVVSFSRLWIRLFGFGKMLLRHVPMTLLVMLDAFVDMCLLALDPAAALKRMRFLSHCRQGWRGHIPEHTERERTERDLHRTSIGEGWTRLFHYGATRWLDLQHGGTAGRGQLGSPTRIRKRDTRGPSGMQARARFRPIGARLRYRYRWLVTRPLESSS